MRNHIIKAEEVFLKDELPFLVDVRSPGEFTKASIPGAVNIPLFSDEERAEVGITYKKEGVLESKLKGIKFFSPKIYPTAKEIIEKAGDKPVVFYCWRGGMRSKIMVKLFDFLGLNIYQLQGGYKAYRRFIFDRLENYILKQRLIVLNGLTGTGKTEIIKRLSYRWPVINLEEMAGHRGSVFGNLGLVRPRSQKDFEALLWHSLYRFRDESFIIIEGEGRRIGPLFTPYFLTKGIKEGVHILLQASLETRTNRILKEYGKTEKELLIEQAAESIRYLERKLGSEKVSYLLELLYKGDFYKVVKTLCRDHYDWKYAESKIGVNDFELIVNAQDIGDAVEEIEKYIKKLLDEKQPLFITGGNNESI